MSYKILWEDRGVVINYYGKSGDLEVEKAVRIAQGDERFDRLLYTLHDFSQCEEYISALDKITEIAAIDATAAQMLPAKKMAVAVVTIMPKVIDSVTSYINSGYNVHDMRIFSTNGHARSWLNYAIHKLR